MRETVRDRERLEHIQAAIDNIFQYTDGKTFQQLKDNTMLFYATVKNIEIIGEAAYKLTQAFCREHPDTPWEFIMKMRHVLVHDYYQIKPEEVWNVVQDDLHPLQEQVARYLAEVDWDEWEKNDVAVSETAAHKTLMQTALRMKNDGLPIKQISRYTGLTAEEIEGL